MAFTLFATRQFRKDYRRIASRGWDVEHLERVVASLVGQEQLPKRYKAHPLKGKYEGHWECHIAADFLLIWYVAGDSLVLVRVGNHSDLFGE